MASKKKKAETRTAKAEKPAKPAKKQGLLPKTVGGAKLPKDVREKLTDLAKHPVVADLLAAGLVAIAARIKNEPAVKEGTAKAVSKALDAAEGTSQDLAHIAANLATAVIKPVVKRIRTAAATPAESPTPAPATRARKSATEAVSPTRRRSTTTTGAAPAKPRATRRTAPKPSAPPRNDANSGPQETDDA